MEVLRGLQRCAGPALRAGAWSCAEGPWRPPCALPAGECVRMVRQLEEETGESVRYIILPTFGYEHKVGRGGWASVGQGAASPRPLVLFLLLLLRMARMAARMGGRGAGCGCNCGLSGWRASGWAGTRVPLAVRHAGATRLGLGSRACRCRFTAHRCLQIFVGPFSRRFPKAQVWVAPRLVRPAAGARGLRRSCPWCIARCCAAAPIACHCSPLPLRRLPSRCTPSRGCGLACPPVQPVELAHQPAAPVLRHLPHRRAAQRRRLGALGGRN